MSLPVESSEVQTFIPESLKNLGDLAPKFRFRSVTERHVRRYRAMCFDDGLTYHSNEAFFAEKLTAIETLWTPEDAAPLAARMRALQEAIRQNIDITDDDKEWLEALDKQLFDNWRQLNVMRRECHEFLEYGPRYAISSYVMGWKNLPVPFRLEAGYFPFEDVVKIARALEEVEKQAIADGIEGVGLQVGGERVPGLAYFELYTHAMTLTSLTKDEEKNLPAPSLSISIPPISTDEKQDGASTTANDKASNVSSPSSKNRAKKKA